MHYLRWNRGEMRESMNVGRKLALKKPDCRLIPPAYDRGKGVQGALGTVHKYAAYTLMAIILLHIFFVVRLEVKEGGGIISAMFTGNKVMDKEPVDSLLSNLAHLCQFAVGFPKKSANFAISQNIILFLS